MVSLHFVLLPLISWLSYSIAAAETNGRSLQQQQQRRRFCSSPGQACVNRRGETRPCCRGPDICPYTGVCPGGRTRNQVRQQQQPPARPNYYEDTQSSSNNNNNNGGGVYEFAVIGDTPYSEYELCGIPYELNKMSRGARFLQHMGDIVDGQGDCAAWRYTRVANAFSNSPVPVHFVMGDNSFNDCPEGEAWGYQQWVSSGLLTYGDRRSGPTVVRGSSFGYGNEYYYFVDQNILFVGLSLPGNAPRDREGKSVEWTRIALEQNPSVAAVVLFGHAARNGYLSGLRRITRDYSNLHFLMLNDSHRFETEYPYEGERNLKLIRVDDTITPMSVYVDVSRGGGNTDNVFTYDRRCYCTTDHRPTKIVQWNGGQCQNACRDVHAACASFETCSPDGSFLLESPGGGLFTCDGNSDCRRYNGRARNEPYCV